MIGSIFDEPAEEPKRELAKVARECNDRAIAWMRHSKPVNPDKAAGVKAAISVHGRQRDARSPPLTPWRISRARLVYSQTIKRTTRKGGSHG
jgi:hypothetical protein